MAQSYQCRCRRPFGNLLRSVGDPSRLTLARSAARPVQALTIPKSDEFDEFGFDEGDIALMCGSHNAEAVLLERAAAILKLLGTTEKTLQCEGHPGLFHTVNHERVKCDFSPGPLTNDCSGEHAGMIAGAKALGADAIGYHLPHYHITCSHFAK